MLVYRVEHKVTGLGPYHSRSNCDFPLETRQRLFNIVRKYFLKRHHVAPSDDMGHGSGFNLYGWLFGFKDEKSLTKWFDDALGVKGLQNLGFRVRMYEVPDNCVKFMKSQVCFHPDDSTRIAEHSFYSFFKQYRV